MCLSEGVLTWPRSAAKLCALHGVVSVQGTRAFPLPKELSAPEATYPGATSAQRGKLLLVLFFFFLGPHPRHMEVPTPSGELELQLLAYTTAHGNSQSLIH